MAKGGSSASIDFAAPLRRMADRLSEKQKRIAEIEKRASIAILRRLPTEAAREISRSILNVGPTKVRPALSAELTKVDGGQTVIVRASKTRLPLSDFQPRFSAAGATAVTWRDQGAQVYPHGFKRKDKRGVWQRIPGSGAGKVGTPTRSGSGLVQRLPIVQLKGPSIHRIFNTQGRYAGHGDIVPHLTQFSQRILVEEIARLLRV